MPDKEQNGLDMFSESFPKLSRGIVGRTSHKADYVRRILMKYNLHRPVIGVRDDLRYTDYRIERANESLLEFTLVSFAPNYEDVFSDLLE